VVQARDPRWLHAYWEIANAPRAAAPTLLRVYELSGSRFTARAIRRSFDIALTPEAHDWYVEVGQAAAWWCLELGRSGLDGRFEMIVRSNAVETPADRPSDEVDGTWGLLDQAFAAHYQTSGGEGSSPGSPQGWPGRMHASQ